MKKSLLTLAALSCIGAFNADAAWVRVTQANQLKAGIDYIFVCESKSSVMSATPVIGLQDLPTHRAPLSITIADGTISDVPEDAARIRFESMGNNTYALHQMNPDNSGYILPVSTGRRTLGMSENPSPNKVEILTAAEAANKKDDTGISLFKQGDAVITSTIQADKNVLGIFLNNYQYCDQNDRGISLYYESGSIGYDFITPSFSPESGSLLNSLNIFTLNFANATTAERTEDAEDSWFTATCNGEQISTPNCSWNYPFTFSYRNAQTTPGIYEFTFKEGFFEMTGADGSKMRSPKLSYKLLVKDSNITYSLSPTPNSNVSSISSFSLTFDNVTKCELGQNATVESVKATHNGATITAPQIKSDRNPVTFVYRDAEALTESGTYVFTIAEGTFDLTMSNGVVMPSPAVSYTLKINVQENIYEYTTNPKNESVINSFEGLTISFPNVATVDISDDASMDIVKEGEEDPISAYFTASASGNVIKVNLNRGANYEMTSGNYIFSFDPGCFLLNGTGNSPAIKVSFTIAGENEFNPNEQAYTLVTRPGAYYSYPAVTIKYEGFSTIEVKEGAQAALYYGDTATEPKYYLDITASGDEVTFTPVTDITEIPAANTTLILKVPAGAYELVYNNVGYVNNSLEIKDYTVKAFAAPDMVFDFIQDGVLVQGTDLKILEIDFSHDPISGPGSMKYMYLKNERGTVIARYTPKSYNKTTNILTLTCRQQDEATLESLAPGYYTFDADAQLYYIFTDKRYYSDAQTIEFYYPGKIEIDVPVFEFTPGNDYSGEINYDAENKVYEATFVTTLESTPVTIIIPEEYDSAYYYLVDQEELTASQLRKADSIWVPEDQALEIHPFVKSNVINVPTDNTLHSYIVMFGKDGNVDMQAENAERLDAISTYPTGAALINAEGKVSFYDMNGLRVANPSNGIFIKVIDGKAYKVIVK